VTQGFHVVTRGSHVVTRGSHVVTRGSHVVTRGSHVVTQRSPAAGASAASVPIRPVLIRPVLIRPLPIRPLPVRPSLALLSSHLHIADGAFFSEGGEGYRTKRPHVDATPSASIDTRPLQRTRRRTLRRLPVPAALSLRRLQGPGCGTARVENERSTWPDAAGTSGGAPGAAGRLPRKRCAM